jgi:hypothetical protein
MGATENPSKALGIGRAIVYWVLEELSRRDRGGAHYRLDKEVDVDIWLVSFTAPRTCPARCFHIGENRSAKVVGFFVGFCPRLVGIRPVLFRFIPNWLLCPALNSLPEALGISGFMRAFLGDPGRNRTCDLHLRRHLRLL